MSKKNSVLFLCVFVLCVCYVCSSLMIFCQFPSLVSLVSSFSHPRTKMDIHLISMLCSPPLDVAIVDASSEQKLLPKPKSSQRENSNALAPFCFVLAHALSLPKLAVPRRFSSAVFLLQVMCLVSALTCAMRVNQGTQGNFISIRVTYKCKFKHFRHFLSLFLGFLLCHISSVALIVFVAQSRVGDSSER